MTWSVLDIYIHSASHLHQTSMLYETTVARVAKCLYMMEHFYRLGRSGFFVDTISSFSTHEMLVHQHEGRCLPSVGGRDCCSQAADVDWLVGIHNLWCCFLVTCSISVVPLPLSLLFVDVFWFAPHHLKGVSVECSEKWFFHFHYHIMHVCSNLFFYIIHVFTNNHRNASFEFKKKKKKMCALQSCSCDATEQNCQIN